MHVAAQVAVRALATRSGRKLLLSLLVGLVGALGAVVIVLVSSVAAVVGQCQTLSAEASVPTSTSTAAPGTSPGASPDTSSNPSFVSQNWSEEGLADIPEDYLPIYESAAKEYGLDAAILAAIGKIETDHGRLDAPGVTSGENPWGAGGPMQFLASTWANVGVDGDGDGVKDRYNPEDAIPGAANYLSLEGAPQDYHSAILAYNNAEWYYQDVIAQAETYRAAGGGPGGGELASASPGSPSSPSLASVFSPLAAQPAYAQEASSGGTGDPPAAWDLVDEGGHIDYELNTQFASDFETAAAAWNALGPVQFRPSPSPAETDLVVTDSPGVKGMALTSSAGTMQVDAPVAEPATENARVAMFGHEQGHALGFLHEYEQESVMDSPIVTNSTQNNAAPTDYDESLYREAWGSGGGSDGGMVGLGGSGEVGTEAGAVFPLPEDYMDDYEDTWGASRSGSNTHEGTDLFAPDGTPIYSITAGEVVPVASADSQGWDQLGGYTIMVEATESVGPVEAGDMLYYAHMIEPAALKPGDTVEAGDVIGKVGSTGEGPPGTLLPDGRGEHLHLGWYTDAGGGRAEAASGAMNPYPLLEWLRENGGTASGEGGTLAPGIASADLPAYCRPLQVLGLVPRVGPATTGTNLSGEDPTAPGSAGGSEASPSGTPSGGTGDQVVAEAKKYLGVPYVLGGPEACFPGEQMDCTCFTTTVFKEFGYNLPDMPTENWGYGDPVEGEPLPGDLLVWDDPGDGTYGHVAISMGGGEIIHANMGTMDVAITPMWNTPQYMGAKRLVQ